MPFIIGDTCGDPTGVGESRLRREKAAKGKMDTTIEEAEALVLQSNSTDGEECHATLILKELNIYLLQWAY
jgi:hypothetical protein